MLDLPQKFKNDIQSKDTYLIPLLVIDDRIFLSTSKVVLGENYDPLLKNIGNIKESIDPVKKIFKISSVNISLINVLYNDKTLGERLFSPSVMNKKLNIYYKSQSAQSLDDCLKVYSGYVASINENIDNITISAEDRTELTLNKDLPSRYSPSEGVPEKYRNKPIPIVFGVVQRSPLIYTPNDGQENYASVADDFFIKSASTPKVFLDDVYLKITKNPVKFNEIKSNTPFSSANRDQFEETDDNKFIFSRSIDITGETTQGQAIFGSSPISYNFVEVYQESKPTFVSGRTRHQWLSTIIDFYGEDFLVPFFGEEYANLSSTGDVTCPIVCSTDINGINNTTEVDGSYFTQQDFGGVPAPFAEQKTWLWGNNEHAIYTPYTATDGYYLYQAYLSGNALRMQTEPFCNSNNILTQIQTLPDATGEKQTKIIDNKASILYDLNAAVKVLGFYTISGEWSYSRPKIHFQIGNKVVRFTRFDELTPDDTVQDENANPLTLAYDKVEFYSDSSTNPSQYEVVVDDIGFTHFTIGGYGRGADGASPEPYIYAAEGGRMGIDWLKFNYLRVFKRAILSDFMDYGLFATVEGRVDDLGGRYTGNEVVVLSGESDFVVRQDMNEMQSRQANISKPMKQQGKKRYKKQTRSIAKSSGTGGLGKSGGSSGGGY